MTSTQPVIPTHMKIRNIQKDIRLYIVNHQILYERSLAHPQDQRIKQLMAVYKQLLLSLGRAQEELIFDFKEEIRTNHGEDNLDEIIARYLSWPDRHLINVDRSNPRDEKKSKGAELVKKSPTLAQRPGSKMKSVLKLKAERSVQQQSAPLVRKESERLKAAAASRTAEAAEAAANNVKQLQSLMKSRQPGTKTGGGMTLLRNKITDESSSTGDLRIPDEQSQPGGLTLAVCGKLLDDAIVNSTELTQDVFLLGTVGLLHKDRLQEIVVHQGRRKRRTLAGQSSYYNDYHQPKKRSWKRKTAAVDADSSDSSEDSDDSDNESEDRLSQESTGSPIKPDLMPKIVLEPMTDQAVEQLTGKNVDSDNTSETSSRGSQKASNPSKAADILDLQPKKLISANAEAVTELSRSELAEKLEEKPDSNSIVGVATDAVPKPVDGSAETVHSAPESLDVKVGFPDVPAESLDVPSEIDVTGETLDVAPESKLVYAEIDDTSGSLRLAAESTVASLPSNGGACSASTSALSVQASVDSADFLAGTTDTLARSTDLLAGSSGTLAESADVLTDTALVEEPAVALPQPTDALDELDAAVQITTVTSPTATGFMDVNLKSADNTEDHSSVGGGSKSRKEIDSKNNEISGISSDWIENRHANIEFAAEHNQNPGSQHSVSDSANVLEKGPPSAEPVISVNSEDESFDDASVSPSDEENERFAVENQLKNQPINVDETLSLEKLIDEVSESETSGDSDNSNVEVQAGFMNQINDDSLEKLIDEDTCDYESDTISIVYRQDTQCSKTSDEVETDCSAEGKPDDAKNMSEIAEGTNESSNSTFSRNKSDDDSPRCVDCVDEDTIVCSSCGEVYSKKTGSTDCPVCETGPCTEDSGCPAQPESDRAWKGWCTKCVALRRDLVNEFEKCRINLNKTEVAPPSLPVPNFGNLKEQENFEPI